MDIEEEKVVETGTKDEEKKTGDQTTPEVPETEEKVEKPEGEIESILDGKAAKPGFEMSIPKEYREEAAKFSSLKEYLAFLHGGSESWDSLMGDDAMKDRTAMLNILKNGGVKAQKAKEFITMYNGYNDALNGEMKKNLDATMKELWGTAYESNKKYMEKGVEVWKNKEIINRFPDLRYNPIVADLLCEIGRANGAPDLLDKGTPHTEQKTNPLDRFGIGIDELM